jgi:Cellulase (glycosyl hydrolase family 5)
MLRRALAVALLIFPILLAPQSVGAAPLSAPSVADPRLFAGANLPWVNWGCDFGCSTTNGVSAPHVRASLVDGFGKLKASGVRTVRWWLFPGEPWQINKDGSGAPASLNPAVFQDLDAALALADQFDLVYELVLFNTPSALPEPWLTSGTQRQRMADTLGPLFERYKNHPRIIGWEVFNEPEWEIWNGKVAAEPVQATVKALAETIHKRTNTPVTVGSASVEGLPLWIGQGLDFYSPHWYDPMTGANCARCTDVATLRSRYGLDSLPIVIGEFYAGPDTDALQRYKDFQAKGFAGAWAWSLLHDRTNDKLQLDLSAAKAFTAIPVAAPTTNTPAPAPVPAPAPGAGAGAGESPGVQLLANWVSPTYVIAGEDVTVHQDLRSARPTSVRVDFELVGDEGQIVSTMALDNQAVTADGVATISTTFKAPMPPGTYGVKTALRAPGGGAVLVASELVGSFVVEAPPPPPPAPQPGPDEGEPEAES